MRIEEYDLLYGLYIPDARHYLNNLCDENTNV